MTQEPRLDGMGALPYDGGVAFRVWAPHASQVSVFGSFNDWKNDANPLQPEQGGYWYGVVEGAAVGDEYKFHLVNSQDPKNVFELDKVDPYASKVTNSVGNSIVYDHDDFDWQGDSFACPPHNELVIYELHVGSFNTPADRVGNFDSVLAKMDHFKKLGVNAVQLMPVMEFAGDRSWGYNPAHIFAVESAYGGPDGLKTLVREFHKNGIAVIIDVVYNHFGPSDLDLWQFDGWSENGKGGIYFYNDWRSQTPWGDARPDYGRAEVRRFIRDNAFMWLEKYHADGLRWDMTAYIRSKDAFSNDLPEGFELMGAVNREVRDKFPGKIMIAEDMHGHDNMVGEGFEQAAFHAQWDAEFVHPLRRFIGAYNDSDRNLGEVSGAIAHNYDGEAFRRVIFTESHDEVANGKQRAVSDVNPIDQQGWHATKRATLGTMVALTAPGIPMIFQGQEFLQGGYFTDEVPLDWNLNEDHQGIVQLHADLMQLRRNWADDTEGLRGPGLNIFHTNNDFKVMAWHRWREHGTNDDVVVVINGSDQVRGNYRIGLPAGGRWELKFNSDSTVYSPHFGSAEAYDITAEEQDQDGFEYSGNVTLAPYSMLVYSWKG
ncbi:alpha-amylase family glycosyl hydrolase [Luteococcus sp. H138]|uniref:alpha-amylase family glycosyl hydrolase n=1 Tax=unclassified Luteococcus TaxID=2639923 RepID=UPI00313D79F3